MEFAKKYPVFLSVCVLSVIMLLIGIVLAVKSMGDVSTAERRLDSAVSQFTALQTYSPSPVGPNIEALETNIANLNRSLEGALERLKAERPFTLATEADVLLPTIVKYIRDFRNRAGSNESVTTDEGEAFGFPTYEKDVASPAKEKIPLIDKQRQILTYIVQRLFDSAQPGSPLKLISVSREYLEIDQLPDSGNVTRGNATPRVDGFQIDPAMTARVENAVDTMAFEVVFSGYTESLRMFTESLAKFELPVVVRSIEVTRTEESEEDSSARSSRTRSSLESLFGAPRGGDSDIVLNSGAEASNRKPIVDQNTSIFTVVMEYVEVSL